MKAKTFDRKFDSGEEIVDQLDLSKARRVGTDAKRVNVDFPAWMVDSLDREARRLGVTRQSLIKLWLAEKLGKPVGGSALAATDPNQSSALLRSGPPKVRKRTFEINHNPTKPP